MAQTAEFARLVPAATVGGDRQSSIRRCALGIHWEDHEELQGYCLPEWSHLSRNEADRYTKALYHVIQRERASFAK